MDWSESEMTRSFLKIKKLVSKMVYRCQKNEQKTP